MDKLKRKEINKRYYQNKKRKLGIVPKPKYKPNKKHNCGCEGKYTTKNKSVHQKTNIHQMYKILGHPLSQLGFGKIIRRSKDDVIFDKKNRIEVVKYKK